MRKQGQGSAAAERDGKGRFSARRKRETVLRLPGEVRLSQSRPGTTRPRRLDAAA